MRQVLADVVAVPWYVLGWLVGAVVRTVVYCRDAVVIGYRDGRGHED